VTVVVEASWEYCVKFDLDTWEGQQYDRIHNVISIIDDGENVIMESTRSWEAWKAGEPNAGRGTWTFPHDMLERALISGDVVWGPARSSC